MREPLADSIGGPTLTALTAVLARRDGWQEGSDGTFRHELDGGQIIFDPATRELEIIATVTAEVSVTEEASAVIATGVSDTVEAEGVGTYYDDGWGGITEQDAQHAAEASLRRSLDEALDARREQARTAADAQAGDAVERRASERAEAAFTAAAQARSSELRREAAARLTAVGVGARALFHEALAEAYRDAILAYALSRRARNLQHSEHDGVLEIEFELDV